jgi:hypothetical protein
MQHVNHIGAGSAYQGFGTGHCCLEIGFIAESSGRCSRPALHCLLGGQGN